jgi:DNA-binding transcriptional regulator YiaG
MPNLGKMISNEIFRLARRASLPIVNELRKDIQRHRRLISALRSEVASLSRDRRTLMEDLAKRLAQPQEIAPAEFQHARLGPKSIHAQRRRLGLTQTEFARLLGVSVPTVSKWEMGAVKPKTRGRAALIAARHLGRREARRRLEALGHLPARIKTSDEPKAKSA